MRREHAQALSEDLHAMKGEVFAEKVDGEQELSAPKFA